MSRNRDAVRPRPPEDETPTRHPVGSLLTLLLIAPAAAVLASRVHGLVAIDRPGGSLCSGTDLLWPIVQLGLPAIAPVIAIPVALLSPAHRAGGWCGWRVRSRARSPSRSPCACGCPAARELARQGRRRRVRSTVPGPSPGPTTR
uniref:Uncharacterized protein n=1 Tax=Janibacter limosus TaxID=53458 RepID=A0AC61U7G3_9MICO|nr:hypothetical protein [Janibacter limosus]